MEEEEIMRKEKEKKKRRGSRKEEERGGMANQMEVGNFDTEEEMNQFYRDMSATYETDAE